LSENDDHLLEAICRGETTRFAVAVDPGWGRLAEHQASIRRRLNEFSRRPPDVVFFDWHSAGCWINADPADT